MIVPFVNNVPNVKCCSDPRYLCAACKAAAGRPTQRPVQRSISNEPPLGLPIYNFEKSNNDTPEPVAAVSNVSAEEPLGLPSWPW